MQRSDDDLKTLIVSNIGSIVGTIVLIVILFWIAGQELNINFFDRIQDIISRYWIIITATIAIAGLVFPIIELFRVWKIRIENKKTKLCVALMLGSDMALIRLFNKFDRAYTENLLWLNNGLLSYLNISPINNQDLIKDLKWEATKNETLPFCISSRIYVECGNYCSKLFEVSYMITKLYAANIELESSDDNDDADIIKVREFVDNFNKTEGDQLRELLDSIGWADIEIPSISAIDRTNLVNFTTQYADKASSVFVLPEFLKLHHV